MEQKNKLIPAKLQLYWHVLKISVDSHSLYLHESLLPFTPIYKAIGISIIIGNVKSCVKKHNKRPQQESMGIPFQNPHKRHKKNAPQLKELILSGKSFSS